MAQKGVKEDRSNHAHLLKGNMMNQRMVEKALFVCRLWTNSHTCPFSIDEHLPGRRIFEKSGLYGQSSPQPVEEKVLQQRSKDMLLAHLCSVTGQVLCKSNSEDCEAEQVGPLGISDLSSYPLSYFPMC